MKMIVDKLLQEELKTQAREINGSERLYLGLYQIIDILKDYEPQKQVSVEPEVKPANGYNEAVDELLKYLGDSLILTLKINYVDYHDDYDILKRLLDRVNIEKSLSV